MYGCAMVFDTFTKLDFCSPPPFSVIQVTLLGRSNVQMSFGRHAMRACRRCDHHVGFGIFHFGIFLDPETSNSSFLGFVSKFILVLILESKSGTLGVLKQVFVLKVLQKPAFHMYWNS